MKTFLAIVMSIFCSVQSWGDLKQDRAAADKLFKDKNWAEALDAYEKLTVSDNGKQVAEHLQNAFTCIQNLNKYKRFDNLVENCVKAQPENCYALQKAAKLYTWVTHNGFIIDNKFERDNNWRRGARRVYCTQRDQVRAMQLLNQAVKVMPENYPEKQSLYLDFANLFKRNRYESWRMQALTDISVLPDHDEGYGETIEGAPVDAEGNPIFYSCPKSFESAKSDGERWRWLIRQSGSTEKYELASFARANFGVQTMQSYSHYFGRSNDENLDGIMAVHTLKDDETIAKLANGVKRFKLPADYNFIQLFRERKNWSDLAQIYENRRQYPKAAAMWRKYLENNKGQEWAQDRLNQIVKNWCRLENSYNSQPEGQGAKIDLTYRNGDSVQFTAHKVDYGKIMELRQESIKDKKKKSWERIQLYNIGQSLVEGWLKECVGDQVAKWQMELKPATRHFDKTTSVTTPLQKAGLYLVKATIKNGNSSHILVWIDNTVIVKKAVDKANLYIVTDAMTGKPLPNLNVEFFCYKDVYRDRKNHREIRNFAEFTDSNGQIKLSDNSLRGWQITAIANDKGRFAVLKNDYFNRNYYRDYKLDRTKCMIITDRPVYRPDQKVQFKAWIRQSKYDLAEDQSVFAGDKFRVVIRNPRNEAVYDKTLVADEFGGIDGDLLLEESATLGQYRFQVKRGSNSVGYGNFRVEEYKKPEFEVKVEAPTEPLKLGDKFTATVKADYYFGGAVTDGEVKVRVMRHKHSTQWFPYDPWDWCYGNGYWWFAEDYIWYPGWRSWGCKRPFWPWFHRSYSQPELVANLKGRLDENGEFKVNIDSTLAKELYGNSDHRYEITAEVRDSSRRTIVGNGKVIAARKPFKVYAWTDRGYYHVGDKVDAEFMAQTVDGKAVDGKAEITLYKVKYDKAGKASETEVKSWKTVVEAGSFKQKFSASTGGQFRLSASVTDSKGNVVEGAHIFTVRGQGFDGKNYRFNDLEITTEKKNYAVGEKVKLAINTNNPESTVYLFPRTQSGVAMAPVVLKIKGKSTIYELDVKQADMPNFYVEALTVCDAKVHTAVRQIVVPPQKRTLNVEVLPSKNKLKPGEKATVKLRMTDNDGKPFSGTMTLAVYDKSLEYIAASSIPNIKEFFWKWQRNYYRSFMSSLAPSEREIYLKNLVNMRHIGAFGHIGATEDEDFDIMADSVAAPKVMKSMARKSKVSGNRQVLMEMKKEGAEMESFAVAGSASAPSEPAVKVRSKFADTAFWQATITTDKNGEAEVEFPMPENLTTWKIKTWGVGHGTKVGSGETEVITSKDFIIRMQAPRFFVEKDEVVLSANIHNYLNKKQNVEVVLELVGENLKGLDNLKRKVTVQSKGEIRVDWRVKAVREGEVMVRMKAVAEDDSDAMEMKFPVYVHGMDKMDSYCAVIPSAQRPTPDAQNEVNFDLVVPNELRPDQSKIQVNFSPSLAMSMIDALPYLVEYPYGCTEQTLNRFLPVVMTNRLLRDMKIDLAQVMKHQNNLNAQEIGNPKERKEQWKKHLLQKDNPVYDNAEVLKMTKAGVERLTSLQNSEGGWGWFGGDRSYPHTTAVVVRGLHVAKNNGAAVIPRVLDGGMKWLKNYQDQQLKLREMYETVKIKKYPKGKIPKHKRYLDNLDALIFSILAADKKYNKKVAEFLYTDRGELSVYGKSLAGLGFYDGGDMEKVKMIERNIRQFVTYDAENQTAYIEDTNRYWWWYWYGDKMEGNAMFLKLLCKTTPNDKVTSGLVKYLLNNRKHATYWNSTRDTAICIEAFADYIRATGEAEPDMTVEVLLNGKVVKSVKINAENLFTVDNTFKLAGREIESGKHKLTVRRSGKGPLYTNAYLSYFTLEDDIKKAGLEVKVERRYYKLTEKVKADIGAGSRGQVVQQNRLKYDRTMLKNLDEVVSGDLVEVELIIESKNDYEYILIEDMKAAGFEPMEINSGYNGNPLGAYVEFRDEKVCFFARRLNRGKHSVTYRLRSEIPGKFSALPARISAMYAPELRGNSDEIKLKIKDK